MVTLIEMNGYRVELGSPILLLTFFWLKKFDGGYFIRGIQRKREALYFLEYLIAFNRLSRPCIRSTAEC